MALVPDYVAVSKSIDGHQVLAGYVDRRDMFDSDLPAIQATRDGQPPIPTEPDPGTIRHTVLNGPELEIVGYMYARVGFVPRDVADNPAFDPKPLMEANRTRSQAVVDGSRPK